MPRVLVVVVLAFTATLPPALMAQGPLDPELLLRPPADAWPSYHGDYTGRHYSPLDGINVSNVRHLSLAWLYRVTNNTDSAIVGNPEAAAPSAAGGSPVIKAMPLMVNGILYFSLPNRVFALDARSGRLIWQFLHRGRGAIGNRGVAMHGSWLYVVAPDNTVISLEAATGRQRWARRLTGSDVSNWSTSAPLIVGRQVLVGIGGDSPAGSTRGFVESLDAETGASNWKWWVTPGPGEPGIDTWPNPEASLRSAGAPWQPFTYDPDLRMLYVTTGQPTPAYNGRSREGANLYTCSVVALNVDTGTLRWYYQFSPHDTHDWDATEVAILIDDMVDGKPRKLLGQTNRNGYYFLLDRETGQPVTIKQYALSNSYLGIDNGVLVPNPAKEGGPAGSLVFPTSDGAVNFPAQSFSPDTGLFYVNATDAGSIFYTPLDSNDPSGYGRPQEWHGGYFESHLKALDYQTGEVRWQHTYTQQGWGSSQQPGVLSTGGGLVFSGDPSGNLIAFDAATGRILWHASLAAQLTNSPQTFRLDGRQYVTVAAADTLFAFYLQ
jgi:alcohol dehydrogenase (cytochrome c)